MRLICLTCFSGVRRERDQIDGVLERETRIELATNSLEGCDSTIELLPLLISIITSSIFIRTPRIRNLVQLSRGLGREANVLAAFGSDRVLYYILQALTAPVTRQKCLIYCRGRAFYDG